MESSSSGFAGGTKNILVPRLNYVVSQQASFAVDASGTEEEVEMDDSLEYFTARMEDEDDSVYFTARENV